MRVTAAEAMRTAGDWLWARTGVDRPARYARFCWGLRTAEQLHAEWHSWRQSPPPWPGEPSTATLYRVVERWLVVFGPADGSDPAGREDCQALAVDDASGVVFPGWPAPWLDGPLR